MSLFAYVFAAMVAFCPPRQNGVRQLTAYVHVANAIVRATDSPSEAILLASIGSFESQYHPDAVGKLGEIGVWQLMLPNVPKTVEAQAVEALRRVHAQGMCGFTGEAANPRSKCPLAQHRIDRAKAWMADHPYIPDAV